MTLCSASKGIGRHAIQHNRLIVCVLTCLLDHQYLLPAVAFTIQCALLEDSVLLLSSIHQGHVIAGCLLCCLVFVTGCLLRLLHALTVASEITLLLHSSMHEGRTVGALFAVNFCDFTVFLGYQDFELIV